MTTRSGIFNSIKSALTAASLIASDLSSSSIPVTIRGEFNNNKDNAHLLPVVTISKAQLPNVDSPFFNSSIAFDSRREARVMIDIYAKKNTHIDQLCQQIDDYISTNGITGLSVLGFDEDDEFQTPNSNLAHRKSLFYTFKVR
jgi:hypothetical protein